MVSEFEIIGVALGIVGLAIAGYQIHLELERRRGERGESRPLNPRVASNVPVSTPSHNPPESAPLPERQVHLRERIDATYDRWMERTVSPGPAGATALAISLRKGDVLRGDVGSTDRRRLDIHVLDEENYGLWRDREGFDQLDGAHQVSRRTFKVEVPADGEVVVALLFPSEGAASASVRLLAIRKTKVLVKRRDADPGL